MKRSILLLLFSIPSLALVQAQKQKGTAYAITSVEKGASKWTEVRLGEVTTGEELKTIYQSVADAEVLNARTGKLIAKKKMMPAQRQCTSLSPPIRLPVPTTKRTTGFITHQWELLNSATLI